MFGLIGGLIGRNDQQRTASRQFKYDTAVYNYNWEQTQRDYQWQLQNNQITRQNLFNNIAYQEETAKRDYQYQLAIRDYDFRNQTRQFNESERIFGLQLGFNKQAAQVAYESENRRFQETLAGMAFEQQDMLVKFLQEEGQIQARSNPGRSAGKALASAMASYGRNQEIMAESLVSARKESLAARKAIATEKYGADLNAQARRMLKPLKAPAPTAPLRLPRPVILDPLKPQKGPAPIKGSTASLGSTIMGGLNNDLSTALSIAGLF